MDKSISQEDMASATDETLVCVKQVKQEVVEEWDEMRAWHYQETSLKDYDLNMMLMMMLLLCLSRLSQNLVISLGRSTQEWIPYL